MEKMYKTQGENEVKFLMTDSPGSYPVVGAYRSLIYNDWIPTQWTLNGINSINDSLNLVEIKPRILLTGAINIYPGEEVYFYKTKEEADELARPERIACSLVTIDCEYGTGL